MRRIVPLLLVLAACSSPQRRIERNQALFNTFPPAAQEKIKKGEVAPGFTPDMVLIALGKPARKHTRTTADQRQEIWSYGERGARPALGFSLGFGSGYYGSNVYAGGVHVGSGSDWYGDERMRVVFQNGQVVSVEERQLP